MLKMLVLSLALVATQASFAATCKSQDGRVEASVTVLSADQLQTTLKIDGQEAPRLFEYCVWTPSIRQVPRCPHQLANGARAEVYPRFPRTNPKAPGKRPDVSQPVEGFSIVIADQPTIKFDCN